MESLRTFPRWIHSFPFPRLKFLISFPSSRAQLDLSARHYVRFDLWKHTTNLFLAFLLPFYLYIYIYTFYPRVDVFLGERWEEGWSIVAPRIYRLLHTVNRFMERYKGTSCVALPVSSKVIDSRVDSCNFLASRNIDCRWRRCNL